MSEREVELEGELTLKGRLNFEYLLANQILTFQKAILNKDYSETEIRESITGFVHLIPENWKDDKFTKEIKAAKTKAKVDLRPSFCGITASEKFCKEHAINPFKTVETFDYYKMFQACINLLNRKKLLSKIVRIEQLEGIDLDELEETTLLESNVSNK